MRKFGFVLGFFFSYLAADVFAAAQVEEALRVSCVPEMGVFRAEVLEFGVERLSEKPELLRDNGLHYWERTGLEKRGFETPLDYDVSCQIDGVTYQMEFYDLVVNEELDDYTKGVVLRADGRYIGDLSPLGTTRNYSYDKLEIAGKDIFVSGGGYWYEHCYHNYQLLVPEGEESYSFNQMGRDKEIVPQYNVAEFLCYRDLGIAGVRLYAYDEHTKLAEGYGWLKDKPQFQCGDIKIVFEAEDKVLFYKKDKTIENIALQKEYQQIYSMMYLADVDTVYIKSFDVKDIERKCAISLGEK